MWWYVGKRLLQTIPVFLFATLLIFLLTKLRPGDPVLALAGNKPISPEVREALLFCVPYLGFPRVVAAFTQLEGLLESAAKSPPSVRDEGPQGGGG